MTAPVRFRLTLALLPGSPAPLIRLRQALKALLRAHRLRCEAIEQLPGRSSGKRRAVTLQLAAPGRPSELLRLLEAAQSARGAVTP